MTEIAKIYDPSLTEDKWYAKWLDKKCFASKPDSRQPFTIVIPPPNVTGVLHMGHMLNNTIQDVLVRKARMEGKNACWVPGTDHASIATEAKVVHMLRERSIKKSDLTREEFLNYAYEWKDKYGGIILEQLKKLGASCDWDRTDFTMNEHYTDAVTNVFIDLYNKGLIYRGLRMVNWDPVGKTALSDEEVIHTTENSKLYYIKYKVVGANDHIVIATTRPETILADTAICINPNDERFKHLHGKKALVPFINREIPVILDEYVTMEFGTGCLKVTPAHDANDYALGEKHGLEVIDILNEDGSLNEKAQLYVGEDRFDVRKKIAKDLEAEGHLDKIEDYQNQVGRSERTNAIIEPRLSLQWFVDMKKFVARNPQVVSDVMEDKIKFHPSKFKNTYKHWMDNIKDWCISRQLWWGQRIPAWYDANGEYVVAKTKEEALAAFKVKGIEVSADIKQDEDVVDTWFSSWLWPLEVFGWNKNPNNEELKYYYPTNDLVTAPEIMFFWVMRMIMAGYEYKGEKPFSNVYFTGIVRDKIGRKMSKQFGNSPDPIELMQKYSADGVRVGMLLSSPAGNDLLFDEGLCEQGRNFTNKIWNAFRLVKGWTVDASIETSEGNEMAMNWFDNRFNEVVAELDDLYSKFRMNEALHATYKLIWDDFCAWYLEMVKPAFIDGQPQPIDAKTYDKTIQNFEKILKLAHPFMPFITEEIWHLLEERNNNEFIMLSEWPVQAGVDTNTLIKFKNTEEIITEIRNFRNSKSISPKEPVEVYFKGSLSVFDPIIIKLGNVTQLRSTDAKVDNSYGFIQNGTEFYIPFGSSVNMEEEIKRIQKEIEYNKGFLQSVMKKLGNEKFVANAKPEVVAIEQKKKDDAESKIKALEEQLESLGQ